VSDGTSWSAWQSFTITPPPNRAPTVTASNRAAAANTVLAASTLINAADADLDPLTYHFTDWGTAATSGYFTVNGVTRASGTDIILTAAEFANTSFVAGSTSDQLYVRVSDGTSWSAWQSFTIAPPPNRTPTASAGSQTASIGTVLAASSLVSATDPDGDALTYHFTDWGTAASSGHFAVNGVAQDAGRNIYVSAADLANTSFVAGSTADQLYVRVSDGTAWSAWQAFTVAPPPNRAPTVGASSQTAAVGTVLAASSFVSANDLDLDSLTYHFTDWGTAASSGYFSVNGVRQDSGKNIYVAAADLANTFFVVGSTSDQLYVRVSDGTTWTDWKTFTISPAASGSITAMAAQLAQASFGNTLASGADSAETSLYPAGYQPLSITTLASS